MRRLSGRCEDYNEVDVSNLLTKFNDVFSDKPGCTDVVRMKIEVKEGADVVCLKRNGIPVKMRDVVRITF